MAKSKHSQLVNSRLAKQQYISADLSLSLSRKVNVTLAAFRASIPALPPLWFDAGVKMVLASLPAFSENVLAQNNLRGLVYICAAAFCEE